MARAARLAVVGFAGVLPARVGAALRLGTLRLGLAALAVFRLAGLGVRAFVLRALVVRGTLGLGRGLEAQAHQLVAEAVAHDAAARKGRTAGPKYRQEGHRA